MNFLKNARLCIGIGRKTALNRLPELLTQLKSEGAHVGVLLPRDTELPANLANELDFVRSHNAFAPDHQATDHIDLARWAEAMILLEADSLLIAGLALGSAGDFVSLQTLAYRGPLAIELAIPDVLRNHPAVTQHLTTLKQRGITLLETQNTPAEFLALNLASLLSNR